MTNIRLLVSIFLMSSLVAACAKGGGGGGGSATDKGTDAPIKMESKFVGIWINEDEAEELRRTKKLISFCEILREEPGSRLENLRFVHPTGAVYSYDPDKGLRPESKMAQITAKGTVELIGLYKTQNPGATVFVSLDDESGILTLRMFQGKASKVDRYLKTTEDEARAYYKAQDACHRGRR